VAIETACGLARRGIRVAFLAASGPLDPSLEAAGVEARVLFHDRYTFGDLSGLAKLQAATWNPRAEAAMETMVRAGDPSRTIVHVHSYKHLLTPSIVTAARRAGATVVMTLHDYNVGCPYGGFYDYRTATPCGERGGTLACLTHPCNPGSRGQKARYFMKHVYQRSFKGYLGAVSAFFPVSDFLREAIESYLPHGAAMDVLPNPIAAPREADAGAEGRKGFLFVGRLEPEKDPVGFAQAARSAGVEATLLGAGELMDEVRTANPDAHVPGRVPREAVWAALRRARALVFSSRWYETQGLVVSEALAAGTPAVVADVTAASGAIEHGATGLLFPAGDRDALAAALRTLDGDPARAAAMSREAFARYWAAPSDPETYLDRLQGLYDRAVAA